MDIFKHIAIGTPYGLRLRRLVEDSFEDLYKHLDANTLTEAEAEAGASVEELHAKVEEAYVGLIWQYGVAGGDFEHDRGKLSYSGVSKVRDAKTEKQLYYSIALWLRSLASRSFDG